MYIYSFHDISFEFRCVKVVGFSAPLFIMGVRRTSDRGGSVGNSGQQLSCTGNGRACFMLHFFAL